jgi:hypothetical protein
MAADGSPGGGEMSRQQSESGRSIPFRDVTLSVKERDLAFYDGAQGRFVVEAGEFEIRIGASSSDIRLRRSLRVG